MIEKYCIECGKRISKNAIWCRSCANKGRKHSAKVNKKKGLPMEKNFFWNGGIRKAQGYIYIKTKECPELLRNKSGYIKRANLVWFKKTGEIIKKPYVLHHKNKDREDDNFKNLQKLTFKEHTKLEEGFRKRKFNGRFS